MPQSVMLKKLKLNGSMRPTRSARTNTPKRCAFHYRGLECKNRKSRNTWSNRQIWPWSTEWNRENVNSVLPRELTGQSKKFFQQERRRQCICALPDGQHQNQIDYILCSQIWRSSIQSAKTRPGTDCGSDHELLIDKFRLKLKKVGNQYTIQVWPESNPLWLYSGREKYIKETRSDRQSA